MKTQLSILFVLIYLLLGHTVTAQKDQMAVEIIPENYAQANEVRDLTIGQLKFTNNTGITISYIDAAYDGFKFLAMNTSASYKGKIVPKATGEVYIVASNAIKSFMETAGWTQLSTETIQTKTSTGSITTLYMYSKSVNFGDTLSIPVSNNYAGVAPVAKTLTIKPDVSTGIPKFNKNKHYFTFSDKILYTTSEVDLAKLNIYDLNGKLVFQKNRVEKEEVISVSSLSSGVYVVRLNVLGETVSQKLIIK